MELAISTKEAAPVAAGDFTGAVARLRSLVGDDLTLVNEAIMTGMDSPVAMIPEIAGHLINSGGKRLRPMLTIAAARALGYEGEKHALLAAAVELIHGATLLHDDVVDDSALRRGASTANIIWGNKESVLVGDFIFSRAFDLMVSAGDLEVLKILSRASGVIAEGEVLQLTTQKNVDATFEMYLAVVESKTAALFAAATHSGAVLATKDERRREALRSFGRNFGVAYQLIDDALDYAGAQEALGKSVGDDFREGKMTLPVVYAIARADDAGRAFWRRTIANGDQGPDDLAKAVDLIARTGALDDTINCARRYAKRAIDDISILPDTEYRDILQELVLQSVRREF